MNRVSVSEGEALLARGYRYLDVRTPAEFAGGHPVGALNVPYYLSGPNGPVLNDEFLTVVRATLPPDSKVLVACATGKRSVPAARALLDAGYLDVAELRPGYAGLRDAFGQLKEAGWAAAGLPTRAGDDDGSYHAILQRA
jgi:rhodanese-related sulfurtransferase